ncbi:MAG: hypothetical protein GX973_01150 [Firmicutes bacterium]|nr:hypothetical protein [Bacillota bacterium]
MLPLVVILLLLAAGIESYFLWKQQLKREMGVSLGIWALATAYAALAISPVGEKYTLAYLITGALDYIYSLFS